MKTQNLVYTVIGIILIIMSITTLIIYYLQDIREQIELKDSLNYNEITIKKYTYEDKYANKNSLDEPYLDSAKAKIGTITIENNGFFTNIYTVPSLVGCINFVNNPDIRRNFNINIYDNANQNYYSYKSQKLKIPPKNKKNLGLYADYTESAQLKYFSKENIKSISVYRLNIKETNPFSDEYFGSSYYYPSNYCDELELTKTPLKVIDIV